MIVNSVDPEEGYEKEISDLSPKECYDLGYYAFKKDKYPLMLRWLKEAKEKFERGEDGWEQVEEARLYEYLSLAYFVAVSIAYHSQMSSTAPRGGDG